MPGTFRPAQRVRVVWLVGVANDPDSGLLIGWRQQRGKDGRPYWAGLVAHVRMEGTEVLTSMRWHPHTRILPVPDDPELRRTIQQGGDKRAEWDRQIRRISY